MATAAIRLDDLTLGYDGHPAVHHLHGTFAPGSMTAVIGPNGSGKSTLLKGMMGMLVPLTGRIERPRSSEFAYLPQTTDIDRSFPASVTDLVSLGLWRRRGAFGGLTAADRRAVRMALGHVGLDGFDRRTLDTLSGGQFQRALFARVLLQDAPVVLLDEPFGGVDERTVVDLLALTRRWHEEGRTVIAVLHDLDLVRDSFPAALLMAREAVAWGRTIDVLRPENLLRARRMTEAWDETAPWHINGGHHHHHHADEDEPPQRGAAA